MVRDGIVSEVTGTCGGEITTTIVSTAAHSGDGADSDELVCTGIDCVPCTATTRVVGDVCARTGTSGSATTTTSLVVGSGAASGESVGICTVGAFSRDGPGHAGWLSVHTGTCGRGTNTTMPTMAVCSGGGAGSVVLEYTSTVGENCTETTKVTGDTFDHIGTYGGAIITTNALVGSGLAATSEWDVINIDGTSTVASLALAG